MLEGAEEVEITGTASSPRFGGAKRIHAGGKSALVIVYFFTSVQTRRYCLKNSKGNQYLTLENLT